MGSAKDKRFTIKAIYLLQERSDIEGIDNIVNTGFIDFEKKYKILKRVWRRFWRRKKTIFSTYIYAIQDIHKGMFCVRMQDRDTKILPCNCKYAPMVNFEILSWLVLKYAYCCSLHVGFVTVLFTQLKNKIHTFLFKYKCIEKFQVLVSCTCRFM